MIAATLAALLLTGSVVTPATDPVPPPTSIATTHPDQTGARPSAYKGRFYRAFMEQYRRCIAQREGRHQYGTTGSGGHYEGTYQMTDALAIGAAWMMQPELKRLFGTTQGRDIAARLRATPMHRWHRFYQDMAFWTVLNINGTGHGARHWAGGRFTCTAPTH